MQKPDYSKISPELRAKLEELDKQRPENQSLQKLQDIALMLQDILMTDDEKRKSSNKTIEEFGALLTDARESLQTIANKEDKEFPDFAKPITDLLDKLVEAVNSKEYSPKIDVKVPDINVPTPQVTVDVDAPDMKGIEKLLKTEVPKAFEEAISKIPETVIPEYPDRWDEVLEWLESIDTASRKKPTPPTQLKVVNPDGTLIASTLPTDTYSAVAIDASSLGNNTIVSITNTARLYYVSLSANGANSADVTAIVKIGTSEKFKVSLKAGSIFARNIGAGRRYLTGSSGDDIIVNLSDAQTVHVSVEYEDV